MAVSLPSDAQELVATARQLAKGIEPNLLWGEAAWQTVFERVVAANYGAAIKGRLIAAAEGITEQAPSGLIHRINQRAAGHGLRRNEVLDILVTDALVGAMRRLCVAEGW